MQRLITVRAETGRLSDASADAVREHLQAIRQIFERDRKRGEGEFYQVFWSYFPLEKAAQQPIQAKTNQAKTKRSGKKGLSATAEKRSERSKKGKRT